MHAEIVTTEDLLNAWRDTTRAAELAERLAKHAVATAAKAEVTASAAEDVAILAERATEAANHAADGARLAAVEARHIADVERDESVPEAAAVDMEAIDAQRAARDAYLRAEGEARSIPSTLAE